MGHVIWDWNGTLYDDFAVNVAAVSESCRSVGGTAVDEARYRRCYTRPITDFYERLLERPLAAGEWDALDRCYFAAYRARRTSCGLVPGAGEALATLAAEGVTQSLLSMWDHADLIDLLAAFEIDNWFVFAEGQLRSGPAGKLASLTRHLARLAAEIDGLTPAKVTVIGDTLDDAASARALELRCVLVETGPHDPTVLRRASVPVVKGVLDAVDLVLGARATHV